MDVSPLQPEKAPLAIEVTELPIVRVVNPSHPEKAPLHIEMTELGIVSEVTELQLWNKPLGIVCTLSPIMMFDIE